MEGLAGKRVRLQPGKGSVGGQRGPGGQLGLPGRALSWEGP